MDHIYTQSYEPAEEKLDIVRKQSGKARREMEGLRGKLGSTEKSNTLSWVPQSLRVRDQPRL